MSNAFAFTAIANKHKHYGDTIMPIYLMMWQSNALGQGASSDLSAPLQALQKSSKIFYNPTEGTTTGEWQYLQAGVNSSNAGAGIVGTETKLMYDLAAYKKQEIGLIKFARGSTGMFPGSNSMDWAKTGFELYAKYFDSYINPALAYLRRSQIRFEIKCLIGIGGEADSVNSTYANAFATNLTQFISDIRTDLNLPNLKMVFPKVNVNLDAGLYPQKATVRTGFDYVAANVSNVTLTDIDSVTLGGDNVHYTAAGYNAIADTIYNVVKDW